MAVCWGYWCAKGYTSHCCNKVHLMGHLACYTCMFVFCAILCFFITAFSSLVSSLASFVPPPPPKKDTVPRHSTRLYIILYVLQEVPVHRSYGSCHCYVLIGFIFIFCQFIGCVWRPTQHQSHLILALGKHLQVTQTSAAHVFNTENFLCSKWQKYSTQQLTVRDKMRLWPNPLEQSWMKTIILPILAWHWLWIQ